MVQAKSNVNSDPAKAAPKKTLNIVEVSNVYHFKPATITVKVGTRVVWKNTTDTDHTVTSDKADLFNLDPITAGRTMSYVFKKTGTYKYHCSIHPYMRAKVIVKK
jgi:plastocyanin